MAIYLDFILIKGTQKTDVLYLERVLQVSWRR